MLGRQEAIAELVSWNTLSKTLCRPRLLPSRSVQEHKHESVLIDDVDRSRGLHLVLGAGAMPQYVLSAFV